MKLIKMLGVVMVAAVAAMALMGASSASAKGPQLCKVNETPCTAGSQYSVPQFINAELALSSVSELKGEGVPPVKCLFSDFGGVAEVKNDTLQQVTGQLVELHFKACSVTLFGTKFACVVTELQLPYRVHLAQTATQGNGIMHVGPGKQLGGQPGAEIFCDNTFIGDIDCTYKSKEVQKTAAEGGTAFEQESVWIKLEVTGGNPAIIKANQAPLKEPNGGNITCPVQAQWLAEFQVTTPKPVFVSHQA